ncbi:hypothetical protein RSOLAG1IB_01647 [Rhizoctonia solani AG-1 IB]|uniref:Uncharacterized protein n=1 Tax=Thanatephorus cucumeris (strain AG1-IB / isolate 7/3/14) TaxID=1108050 RepID=A0A0B7FDH2_THACB|nr:hypothetical protein RSOLAG1IB_01647 [Rhizoctonia solani AG-1 IB]
MVATALAQAGLSITAPIIPGGQAGAASIQEFGQQAGNLITWTVNIAGGTLITFMVRDSTGAVAYSAPVSVQSSADSSCLSAGSSSISGGEATGVMTTNVSAQSTSATTSQWTAPTATANTNQADSGSEKPDSRGAIHTNAARVDIARASMVDLLGLVATVAITFCYII